MTKREKKAPQRASPGSLLTGWARHGVQSFIAVQKILLDLAAQENALLIAMGREGLGKTAFRPFASMVGIAETGVKNMTSVGKILLDLAAAETALIVGAVKEGLRLTVPAEAMAEVVRLRVESLVEMQKRLLDATAQQAQMVAESLRTGKGTLAVTNLEELGRRGIEGFVESEKKFLNAALQEISAATKGNKRTGKPPRERMQVLTTVIRDGAENCIDAQKKVLDLAIEQLEATVKAGQEHKVHGQKEVRPLWSELTEKGVKNFVTAEKSLLDLAMEPMKGRGREGDRKALRPRHGTHRVERKHATGAREAVAKVA